MNTNHLYLGLRDRRGPSITVDGEALRHIVRHSPTGLEWGYGGSGPADTALSLLTHHFGHQGRAERHYQQFKVDIVAGLPRDGWTLTSEQIEDWMHAQAGAP